MTATLPPYRPVNTIRVRCTFPLLHNTFNARKASGGSAFNSSTISHGLAGPRANRSKIILVNLRYTAMIGLYPHPNVTNMGICQDDIHFKPVYNENTTAKRQRSNKKASRGLCTE